MREDGTELETLPDGRTYALDDLHRCGGCGLLTPDPLELDDEGECEDCAEASREAAAEMEDLRRWARWACR